MGRQHEPEKWTYNECLNIALSFSSYSSWRDEHAASYSKASKKNWLPEIKTIWLKENKK